MPVIGAHYITDRRIIMNLYFTCTEDVAKKLNFGGIHIKDCYLELYTSKHMALLTMAPCDTQLIAVNTSLLAIKSNVSLTIENNIALFKGFLGNDVCSSQAIDLEAWKKVSTTEFEIYLLNMWAEFGYKYVYKYKHRIKAFRGRDLTMDLFHDITQTMFMDVPDIVALDTDPEECHISIEELLNKRKGYKE